MLVLLLKCILLKLKSLLIRQLNNQTSVAHNIYIKLQIGEHLNPTPSSPGRATELQGEGRLASSATIFKGSAQGGQHWVIHEPRDVRVAQHKPFRHFC